MNKNIFNLKSVVSFSLMAILILSLASCSSGKTDTAFLDQISAAEEYSEEEQSTEVSVEPPTEDGYTQRPIITHVKNIKPYTVLVTGTCEEGSKVKIYNVANDKEVYETQSIGNYFIMEISLSNANENYYEICATVEGKKESTVNHFTAKYDAVAEKPADGTAVSLGKDSTLYFDKLIDAYMGKDILTNTQLDAFKNNVAADANKNGIKYVYVMIPELLTVYEDRISDDIQKDTFNTKFQQIIKALSEVDGIDVLDLTSTFIESKDGEYPLYYNTSGNLSEYGSYLTYKAIIDYINGTSEGEDLFPYSFETVDGKGGNMISALGFEPEYFAEKYVTAKKGFESTIPDDADCSCKLSELMIYEDILTNTYYKATDDDEVFGANESLYFKTNRTDLPSAVFLRDETSNPMVSMLAEHFNNSYFEANGNFSLTSSEFTSAISDYATDGNTYVDYVFVIVTESNINSIIG